MLRPILQNPPQYLPRRTLRHLLNKPHSPSQSLMTRHFLTQPLYNLLRVFLRVFTVGSNDVRARDFRVAVVVLDAYDGDVVDGGVVH